MPKSPAVCSRNALRNSLINTGLNDVHAPALG
jgi:hypothetical protein